MQDYLISRFNFFSLDTGGLTPENLTIRSKKEFEYVLNSEVLVVCLPGWGARLGEWNSVKSCVLAKKQSFLVYEFPRSILSDKKDLTKSCFNIINKNVRGDIQKLKEQYGFKKCVLITVSLASSFGSMVYRDNQDIDKIIHIAPGNNLAENMWYGCRTQHLRKSYEKQGITLEMLNQDWYSMASQNNMPSSQTKISIFYAEKDNVILYRQSIRLFDVLKSKGFKVEKTVRRMGHYFLITYFLLFPKRFIH